MKLFAHFSIDAGAFSSFIFLMTLTMPSNGVEYVDCVPKYSLVTVNDSLLP